MGWGRRIAALLIPLALILIGLFWPLVLTGASQRGTGSDPVWFSHYQADYDVKADGRVEVVETINAQFPGGKHGIFEFWDIAAPHDPHVRMIPTVTSVMLDDEPVPYQMLWDDSRRFLTAKIGDPATYLDPGSHEFVIRSAVPNALAPSSVGKNLAFASSTGEINSTPSVFYWFVVKSWDNRIDRADISVTLPAQRAGVQCSVGFGRGDQCPEMNLGGDRIEMTIFNLAPRTPVTVRAGVDIATPPCDELPWSWRFDRIFGQSVTKVLVLLGASVAAGLLGYAWWRTTVESNPGFPLQYAPPAGLGPVQCEYIRTEAVPRDGLTATLFYLAERGLISLTQRGEKHWTVKGLANNAAWKSIDPVSRDVAWALKVNEPGAEFEATNTVASGKRLSKAKTDMTEAVKKWAKKNNLLVSKRAEQWVRVANLVSVIVAVCGFITWGFTITLWGLPFAVFFVATMRSWAEGVGSRRTPAGRELWSRAGGFHRMLTTDSAEARFDFGARKDLYTAYIPFAVAAGAAALWAKKYEAATGTVAPQPDWYHSSTPWAYSGAGGSHGPNFDSFESTLSSSIGAYSASQSSSSSSSSSGGGFSGGGGGGGGGSW